MSSIDTADYKKLFFSTAQDHLTAIEGLLDQFASGHDPSYIAGEVFRHIHSLKGSSQMMNYSDVATICNEIDSHIHPDANTFYLDPQYIDELQRQLKKLQTLLNGFEGES